MHLTTHNTQTSHLPESIQEIVDVIGLNATLLLVQERGGISMHVPTKAKEENWIAKLIGFDEMKKLVCVFAGETIHIARCAAAIKQAQHEEIFIKHIQRGISQSKLAREYGYDERSIQRLISKMKKQAEFEQTQHALF